jgi:hypothetical protein
VNLEVHKGWTNSNNYNGEKITIDQALIAKQFGVSIEGAMDIANALVKKARMPLKNIARSDAFVSKE